MKSEVSMSIAAQPAWLSWVGATTMCLKALGVECDQADVAGHSGYAFALSINTTLCASGPTCLQWTGLADGIPALGRSTLCFCSADCYTGEHRNERTRAHARQAFELVQREIQADRPCVVWGLGVPEFGVVRGVEGEEYRCVKCGPTPERLRWDEINAPGGPYVLAFPSPVKAGDSAATDREAIRRAVTMLTRFDHDEGHRCGLLAYDYWRSELSAGRAVIWTNSYNAQCWSEARELARDFVGRVADRHPQVLPLRAAHQALVTVSIALCAVAGLFPFDMKFDKAPVTDRAAIEKASGLLLQAQAAEAQAIEALKKALWEWV